MIEFLLGIMTGVMSSITVSIGLYLKNKNKKPKEPEGRLHISMVRPGQRFKLEHDHAAYKICTGTCISNDTYKKEILFEIHWSNSETKKDYKQQYVLPYNAKELIHFHILNINEFEIQKDDDETSNNNHNDNLPKQQKIQEEIKKLKSILSKHIQKEEYEKAQEIQNKIDKLNQKLK